MGYTRHHAIVVTSSIEDLVGEAHATAVRIFEPTAAQVTPLMRPTTNGFVSFAVLPDGSKEAWEESDAADRAREEFVTWLDERVYEDGSTSLPWAEVQFGDENGKQRVVSASGLRVWS